MLKKALKKAIIKGVYLCLAVISMQASAYTLNLSVKGNQITFDNAYQTDSSDIYTLSDWQPIGNLTPTNSWQPDMMTSSATEFKLTGPSGTEVIVPIKIVGAEYNIGGNSSISTSPAIVSGSSCGTSTLSSDAIQFKTTNLPSNAGFSFGECVSDKSYQTDKVVQPFYFLRPDFHIDTDGLISALSKAGSPVPGQYSGSIPVSLRYYFIENGTLTYRVLPSGTFNVRINYIPEVLTEIIADSRKDIIPTYNTSSHTASGETIFNVIANGYFQSGIKMTFQDRAYNLTQVTDDSDPDNVIYGESEIPYYIRCDACSVASIVENGVLQENAKSPVEYEIEGPLESFSFNLKVGYENISAETVNTGMYMDTFTILFEEIL